MARETNGVKTTKYKITQRGIKKEGSAARWWGLSVIELDILKELNRRRKSGLSREELERIFKGAGSARIANALRRLKEGGHTQREYPRETKASVSSRTPLPRRTTPRITPKRPALRR